MFSKLHEECGVFGIYRNDPDVDVVACAYQMCIRDRRMTVILFYYRDRDLEETARILAVPTGTVKSRLNRARQLLRKELADETDLFL